MKMMGKLVGIYMNGYMNEVKIYHYSKWNWNAGGFQIQSFVRVFHKSNSNKIGFGWDFKNWLYEQFWKKSNNRIFKMEQQ